MQARPNRLLVKLSLHLQTTSLPLILSERSSEPRASSTVIDSRSDSTFCFDLQNFVRLDQHRIACIKLHGTAQHLALAHSDLSLAVCPACLAAWASARARSLQTADSAAASSPATMFLHFRELQEHGPRAAVHREVQHLRRRSPGKCSSWRRIQPYKAFGKATGA